jgi:hypothetical protein
MEQKVYVVTDAGYSDMGVIGVFSTMEAANAFCELHLTNGGIDEFTVDDDLRAVWLAKNRSNP